MRAKKVAINSLWGIIYKVFVIFLGFIGRTAFIHFLSVEYLGIAGLFTNVLTILSLSELGFSTAISYHLYKFLAKNDYKKITEVMNFYRNVYRVVAISVLSIGLIILPFLKYIVKDTTFSLEYISLIYIIYLLKTVLSYLFSYNFTIAIADQKRYLLTKIDIIMHIIMSLTNILILFLFKNYIIYLLGEILLGIIKNIIKSLKIYKEYPYIKAKSKIESEMKNKILKDVKNIFAGKISTVIITSTDNILISALINVKTVGLYANYSMLIAYIQNILGELTTETQASLGNMLNSESKEYAYITLKRLTIILYFITSFCSVCIFNLINPFIEIWLGKEYLLGIVVVFVCVLNFYIQILKTPLWFSVTGIGYFEKDRNIAIIGAISNLVISIIAAYFLGLAGIFLGTVISQTIQWFMKVDLFIKGYLKKSVVEYMRLYFYLLFLMSFMCIAIYGLLNYFSFENDINAFVVKFIVCIFVPNIVNFILFYKTEEYKYLLSLFKRFLKKV